jgi:23S rRNA pseudoU1915 N3-methylase RlmH
VSFLTDIVAARDDVAATLRAEAARLRAEAQGGTRKPTYSIDGKSVSWGEYSRWWEGMIERFKQLNELVVLSGAEGLDDNITRVYT